MAAELVDQVVSDRLEAQLIEVERYTTEAFGAGELERAGRFHAVGQCLRAAVAVMADR